ncbi:hypothetical protein BGP76_09295 [Reichenbachiella sp. MSK19-1]|nr:hypothetical protein BGP76_09295 [Reichenbachiella sp. MSK19-1]
MRHSKSICELTGLKINPHEAYIISEKLSLDGHLTVDESDKWVFSINYEGIMFHRYGGYKQQLKDIKRKRLKDDLYKIS